MPLISRYLNLLADGFTRKNLRRHNGIYNVYYYWHISGSYNYWWDYSRPPSMVYISIINFYTLHYTIFQVLTDSCRPLWAAFLYCFKHLSFLNCGHSFKLYSLDCSCSVVHSSFVDSHYIEICGAPKPRNICPTHPPLVKLKNAGSMPT